MRITKLLAVFFLVGLSACSGEEKSFYMTNNDQEISSVNCTTKNVKVRTDVSSLNGYTGGDLRVQFEMMDPDMASLVGAGIGEVHISAADIPEDQMVWIDLTEGKTPVAHPQTQEAFNLFHFCDEGVLNRPNKCVIRITYYEQVGDSERKVGYEDTVPVVNY